MAALHQYSNVSVKKLKALFPQYSLATIYRHAKKDVSSEDPVNMSKFNKGRPRKLSDRDCRSIVKALKKLRNTEGHFSSPRIAVEAGIKQVSNRTVRRTLNREGYKFLQTRRKGLMKAKDFKDRVDFCKKVKNNKLGHNFWTHHISFYMDACGFEYKKNPEDQARAPSAREWRKRSEGLLLTAKGKKEGSVNTNFMVGISYDHGVVLCERYLGAITGEKMANIARTGFPSAFENSISPTAKRVLMDGCPKQHCKQAYTAYDEVKAKIMKIPSRSPDLNCIENFFNLIKKELRKQALQRKISNETMEEFSDRVKNTMLDYPTHIINEIIGSMDKRIDMILKAEGKRIKY